MPSLMIEPLTMKWVGIGRGKYSSAQMYTRLL